MKKSRIIVITAVSTTAFLLLLGFLFNRKNNGSQTAKVRLERVSRGELIEFVSAAGEIEPKTKVEISAKVSARIVELPYAEGDTVTRGNPGADPPVPPSVLIRLDSKDLESQLRSTQASYMAQAAQIEVEKSRIAGQQANLLGIAAQLEQAQRNWERKKGLLESNDISQSDFDQAKCSIDDLSAQHQAAKHALEAAKLNLTVLQHNLDAADARISQAQDALTYTTIESPIDGVVTRINAEVGEVVVYGTMNNPGTVIMQVADLSKMLLVAEVAETDVGKLKVGQRATVYVDAFPDEKFSGVVETIALTHTLSANRTKYFRTEILLDAGGRQLYSGLTAHVEIETFKHSDIIKVPTQAVVAKPVDELPVEIRDGSEIVDTSKTYATVVNRFVNGKAVVTPVKIGRSDLTHTIILSGLAEGETIVVGPYKIIETLKHNQSVADERQDKLGKDTGVAKVNADTNDPNNG